MIEQPSRRGFITGLGALFISAPAIVRASSLMPIKALSPELLVGDIYSLERLRNLLLPGLWKITNSSPTLIPNCYPQTPAMWRYALEEAA
jgi:hypothetical protein